MSGLSLTLPPALQQRREQARQYWQARAPVSPAQAGAALQAATERLGEKGRLSMQGDRASLTLNGVGPEALRGWLLEARSAARARPVEAQLTRSGAGFSGTVVVQLSAGSNP